MTKEEIAVQEAIAKIKNLGYFDADIVGITPYVMPVFSRWGHTCPPQSQISPREEKRRKDYLTKLALRRQAIHQSTY